MEKSRSSINVYYSFFKSLQWFFICGVYQNHPERMQNTDAALPPTTFECMKQRFVFLVGSQATQTLLVWAPALETTELLVQNSWVHRGREGWGGGG